MKSVIKKYEFMMYKRFFSLNYLMFIYLFIFIYLSIQLKIRRVFLFNNVIFYLLRSLFAIYYYFLFNFGAYFIS